MSPKELESLCGSFKAFKTEVCHALARFVGLTLAGQCEEAREPLRVILQKAEKQLEAIRYMKADPEMALPDHAFQDFIDAIGNLRAIAEQMETQAASANSERFPHP